MYPFERFTERAKKTLTLAQEEAERSRHSYIGTEHLLLGILRNQDGMGYRVLELFGVRIEVVRETIESVLGRNERITGQQILPTSRVKKVIELSFEEARRMRHDYVGTEHLLLGLMIEGEGIAARVLSDLGVTEAKIRDEVEHQLTSGAVPEAIVGPRMSRPTNAPPISQLETLQSLLANPLLSTLLRARGLGVEGLIGQLESPPEVVISLRLQLSSLSSQLDRAVKEADYERAAQFERARAEVAATLRQAEQEWLNELTRPPDST